jgi:tetratricopeptide (TPR) repeat protein
MLPFSIFFLDLFLIRGFTRKNVIRSLKIAVIPVFFLAVAATLYSVNFSSILAGYEIRPFTLSQRLLTEPRIVMFYLSLIVYPLSSRMSFLHDINLSTSLFSPSTTLFSIIALLLMILFSFYSARKWPLLSFSILFFLMNHIIESSIIPLELIFEHRNYLPSIFLFVPAAIGILKALNYFSYKPLIQHLVSMTTVIVMIAFGHTTYMQNLLFQNKVVFWSDNVKKYPGLHRPRHNLAKEYISIGLIDLAIEEMRFALTKKNSSRKDQKLTTYYNLGICQLIKRDYKSAVFYSEQALKVNEHPAFYNMIALSRLYMGNIRQAEQAALLAINMDLKNMPFRSTYGWVLLKKGDIEEGLKIAMSILKMEMDDKRTFFLAGEALRVQGRLKAAEFFLRQYYNAFPNDFAINAALSELYVTLGDTEKGPVHFSNLIRLSVFSDLDDLMIEYDRRYNCLGPERIRKIRESICAADFKIVKKQF